MAVSQENQERYYRVRVSRNWKDLLMGLPDRFAKRILAKFFAGFIWRWLFLSEDGELTRAGEIVLADLRDDFLTSGTFHKDPIVMAKRVGNREVIEQILNYLALDETQVLKMMELDDELE